MIYFHNLKFDGHFLLDWLLKNGFTFDSGDHKPKMTFSTLISAMGMVYSISVVWQNGKTLELRDSLKKIPMTVARTAKAFGMSEGKGDIDYHAIRPIGYMPTLKEIDYLRRDIKIIATALSELIDSGMTRLTVASDSMAEYKRIIGEKVYKRLFPVLDEDMDAEIRKGYRGGFTYLNPKFRGKQCGGIVLDVNSLYPSVMYNEILPYGEPIYEEGEPTYSEEYPLSIFTITFTAKLKPNHIPCIQIKGSKIFGSTEYLTEIKEPTTITLSNVDLDLYKDHYDIEILSYGGGWRFKGAKGLFKGYIDKWAKIKEESKGGKREIAKLHLNSLYGKFASNPDVTGKVPVLDVDRVKYVRGEDETRPPVYTAMGVFITAYARDITIREAQRNYATFAYADTDSLHLMQPDVPDTIDLDPDRMGAWKREYGFTESHFVRPKFYLELKENGEYKAATAGLPEKISNRLTFDTLREGTVLHGKLRPRSVPGGIVLEDVPYKINL